MLFWGVGYATQDTLLKAIVAECCRRKRNFAFGLYYAGYGVGWLSAASWRAAVQNSHAALIAFSIAVQLASVRIFRLGGAAAGTFALIRRARPRFRRLMAANSGNAENVCSLFQENSMQVYRCKPIGGSNPSLSAKTFFVQPEDMGSHEFVRNCVHSVGTSAGDFGSGGHGAYYSGSTFTRPLRIASQFACNPSPGEETSPMPQGVDNRPANPLRKARTGR